MKIFLDFGHGGNDSGATSNGLVEKNMTLVTGLECKKILEEHGVEIKASRLDDRAIGLSERAKMANTWGAEYFVSIHYNAGGGDGTEVIHSIYGGKGEVLAKAIVSAINKETGQNLRPRATYSRKGSDGKDYYAVIRETKMDAVIVECGFIDSGDRTLYDTIPEQEKMGKAIAYGILNYLGISIKRSENKKYYVRTGDVAKGSYGIEIKGLISKYFSDIDRIYVLEKNDMFYFETQYLSKEKAAEVVKRLSNGSLSATIIEE
ncbi:N-acetylmuramoyl-L-alanine amidase [Clostridium sp.]|uniref:N-acetylmuramoyl-L-alanine amidase family protein n=1 Tax=Clostridium sp. TaxID=1506 RepID=UPI002FC9D3FB